MIRPCEKTGIAATLTADRAARKAWDAIVIGAGPAGALAARELARQGAAVLLIDRARFPRDKVCGGCLNAAALSVLQQVGLGDLPRQCGAPPLHAARLATRWSRAEVPLPQGASLSRAALDAALAGAAIAAGAAFLPETSARVGAVCPGLRRVRLPQQKMGLRSRVVLVADGLSGRALAGCDDCSLEVAPTSRVGLHAILRPNGQQYERGVIYLAGARGVYLGIVELEDGQLNLAACCDPAALRASGCPAALVARLLDEVGLPAPAPLDGAVFQGTPPLTRRRSPRAAERVLVLGDAAGYVEPFTGEGMAWALHAAQRVAPLALEAMHDWNVSIAAQWNTVYEQEIAARQAACRQLARLLRQPLLSTAATLVVGCLPALGRSVAAALNRPFEVPAGSQESR